MPCSCLMSDLSWQQLWYYFSMIYNLKNAMVMWNITVVSLSENPLWRLTPTTIGVHACLGLCDNVRRLAVNPLIHLRLLTTHKGDQISCSFSSARNSDHFLQGNFTRWLLLCGAAAGPVRSSGFQARLYRTVCESQGPKAIGLTVGRWRGFQTTK